MRCGGYLEHKRLHADAAVPKADGGDRGIGSEVGWVLQIGASGYNRNVGKEGGSSGRNNKSSSNLFVAGVVVRVVGCPINRNQEDLKVEGIGRTLTKSE